MYYFYRKYFKWTSQKGTYLTKNCKTVWNIGSSIPKVIT